VRDLAGNLIQVDNRSVNFARQRSEQLRFGAGFTVPLIAGSRILADKAAGTKARRIPPLNLQVNGSYRILLNNRLLIRDGLPQVDLLEGGAIGIVGGQQKHSWDFNLALTKGSTGLRMVARNRGVRYLATGTIAAPDLLTFHSITTVDLKAFAGLGQLFPKVRMLKDTRLSLNVDNLLNKRQKVEDLSRAIPQAYQPVRLDPLGRTIMLEIRKVF
jgi:outer membrane receptor protein involved in Fe transport